MPVICVFGGRVVALRNLIDPFYLNNIVSPLPTLHHPGKQICVVKVFSSSSLCVCVCVFVIGFVIFFLHSAQLWIIFFYVLCNTGGNTSFFP